MEIRDFDTIRVGSGWPAVIDISKIKYHEECGVIACAYTFSNKYNRKIEVRKKENQIALINYAFGDMELPIWWQDAEIIYSENINKR